MAEKTLNTRFQLPYDTYTNWSAKNPKLKKGEMVQVEVPAPKDAIVQAPSVLIKVGDGTQNFDELAWASGLAADIYDWAKSPTKPSYTADEIGAEPAGSKVTSYSVTIMPASWTTSGNIFKYTYSNTNLRASISPIITCISNTSEYNYITDAEATANTGITFTAKIKPSNNIILQIIDLG